MLGMCYVGYYLQHLRVSVYSSAVFQRTSSFPAETGERSVTLADWIDPLKHDGVSPIIAEVVFVGGGVAFVDEVSGD
jgi:hypothetical protein